MIDKWIDKQTSIGRTPREIKDDLPSMVMSGWFNKFEATQLHIMFNDGDIDCFLHMWRKLYRAVKNYPRCSVVFSTDNERKSGENETLGFHPQWDAKEYCQRIEVRKYQIYPYGYDLDKFEREKVRLSLTKSNILSSGQLSEIYQPLVEERNLWEKKKKPKIFSVLGKEVSTPKDTYGEAFRFYISEDILYQPDCRVVSFDTNLLLTMSNDELIEDIPHRTILNHFLDNDSIRYSPIGEYQSTEIDNYWKEIDEEEEKKLSWSTHSVWENKLISYQDTLIEGERIYGY